MLGSEKIQPACGLILPKIQPACALIFSKISCQGVVVRSYGSLSITFFGLIIFKELKKICLL
jgi:hypothetical protein